MSLVTKICRCRVPGTGLPGAKPSFARPNAVQCAALEANYPSIANTARSIATLRSPSARALAPAFPRPRPTRTLVAGMATTAAAPSLSELAGSLKATTVELDEAGVAVLTLNRPKALNALNLEMMEEVVRVCQFLDAHPEARVIVLIGSGDKAFAAGADIKEMAALSHAETRARSLLSGWESLAAIRKPIIAAVNGYALGGGCELALLCDITLASEKASFGQPEIGLGIIPGMGGSQRFTRAVGKSRAMEIVLTGGRIDAAEAVSRGLASRAVPHEQLLPEAVKLARTIAERSLPVIVIAKECVNVAYESSLAEGLRFEKRAFWSCFALADQKEGMAAFIEKRPAKFEDA